MNKIAFLFCIAALALTSCKRSGSQVDASFEARPAPAWKLHGLDGKELSSADLRGKVQVINFWATWCPPCKAEIPGFIEVQEKFRKEGLVIVGVSLDQDGADVVKRYAENAKINYPVALAEGGIDSAFGKIEGIPTTFIVDRQGMIRAMDVGYMSKEKLEKHVKPLLDAKG